MGIVPLRHLLNKETLFLFLWRSGIKEVNEIEHFFIYSKTLVNSKRWTYSQPKLHINSLDFSLPLAITHLDKSRDVKVNVPLGFSCQLPSL